MKEDTAFQTLTDFLGQVPAIAKPFGHGFEPDGTWWLKFAINIDHPLIFQSPVAPAFIEFFPRQQSWSQNNGA